MKLAIVIVFFNVAIFAGAVMNEANLLHTLSVIKPEYPTLIPFSYFSPDFTSLTTPEIDHDVLFMSDGASVDIKQCANIISAYSCPITAFSNISCSPNNVEHCRSKTIDISAPFTRIHRLGNDLIEIATTEEAYIYCNGKCQTVTMPSSGIMVTRLHKGEYIEVGSQIYRGMGSSETIFHFPTV
uniref:Uncharacterized protein n=1 Tax=Panagrolaimus superbus TaxID=310955 RepID=A0A914YF68_9BILA